RGAAARESSPSAGKASCGELGLAGIQPQLEEAAQLFTADPRKVPRSPRLQLQPHHAHHRVVRAVAAEVALLLAQRPQPSHDRRLRRRPDRSDSYSYCSAWSTFRPAARRAGSTAARIPTTIAARTKYTTWTTGKAKTIPSLESACVTSAARNVPTTIPRAAPISAVTMLS